MQNTETVTLIVCACRKRACVRVRLCDTHYRTVSPLYTVDTLKYTGLGA
uniref:Uncharacterized protein n=1 Tax=Anguilla anguilla TaxID=7936 RepID=A0A0E9WUI7_ANGAN